MGQGNANLASLIGSRICHDLISPIGAIHNGLELLDMSGGIAGPEMGLIADSVENADARIRFFRLTYGAATDHPVARSEILSVLDDVSRNSRIEFHWYPEGPQPRSQVRLAFLALQCCETAMPYGGTAEVLCDNGTWTVRGHAERLSVDPALWASLSGAEVRVDFTPALVQFALLPVAAEEAGRSLEIATTRTEVTLRF